MTLNTIHKTDTYRVVGRDFPEPFSMGISTFVQPENRHAKAVEGCFDPP